MKLEDMTHEQVSDIEFYIESSPEYESETDNETYTAEDIMGLAAGRAQLMVYEAPEDSQVAQEFLQELDQANGKFDGALMKTAIDDILEASSIFVDHSA